MAFQYHFEWDPAKARQNAGKHRITFERGATVFKDPNALSLFDEEHSDEEERWITLGLDGTGVLLVISHTFDEEAENLARIRLVSVRKATKNEKKQYLRK
ncbi:MAG TPA: BrnT family toxin, partial [Candidatus Binatia bacterium]|nr:BrnT family toxin [Candidatus Binatia bacterium]